MNWKCPSSHLVSNILKHGVTTRTFQLQSLELLLEFRQLGLGRRFSSFEFLDGGFLDINICLQGIQREFQSADFGFEGNSNFGLAQRLTTRAGD